ncbi:hypothetical protein [Streptomyces sp. NBC_01435]|nr:hypothetical protein [Streptomyces sp. NBC_01435]
MRACLTWQPPGVRRCTRPWNSGHGKLSAPLSAAEGQQLMKLLTRVYEA